MPAKKSTEPEPMEAADAVPAEGEQPDADVDQPVPELRHPSAPGYVLREGQWVYDETAESEPEAAETEKPEE